MLMPRVMPLLTPTLVHMWYEELAPSELGLRTWDPCEPALSYFMFLGVHTACVSYLSEMIDKSLSILQQHINVIGNPH